MKKNILFLFLIFIHLNIKAQDIVISSGSSTSNTSGSVSFSFGQTIFQTVFSAEGVVSQGIQQTFDIETNTFVGTTNNDWSTTSNWSLGVLPTNSHNVIINNVANDPVINSATGATINNITVNSAGSLTVNDEGSIIVNGISYGEFTYNINIPDNTNWRLIASPAVGEQYGDTWNTNNSITTNLPNEAVGSYINTSDANGDWIYFQDGGADTTFGTGIGYSVLRASVGNLSFMGTFQTNDLPINITANAIGTANENSWNLIGNSFPAYLDVNAFLSLSLNATALSDAFEAIYIWTGSEYTPITTGYLKPGKGFFVNSNITNTTVNINKSMLGHKPSSGTVYKTENPPSIKLSFTNGDISKSTLIRYIENKTIGLDPRFDIGMFTGTKTDFSIYSHLVSENSDIAFTEQTLPKNDYTDMIIPIGINADKNQEIVFSADVLNIPDNLDVVLEDKQTNTFTKLNEEGDKYSIILTEDLKGTGRFYLHTNRFETLSNSFFIFDKIQIFKTGNKKLKVTGLNGQNATVKVYSILGREIYEKAIESDTILSLPNYLRPGIYIIKLNTQKIEKNKKVVIY